ncbi:MAG TPA: alpha-glucosidase [Acholeplasma sp.]|nr:alpha-glucosidase [Acholeplasma sp.]
MANLWWQNMLCYQIYPRSFNDTNSDGVGDINGIIEKLDYLSWLGINAIWLSPVYQSPNDDYGYDIKNYYDVNEEYGRLADLERLIEKAKEKNIKIIMDLVMNHTSDEHPWFIESKNPESPYRDYYIYQEGKNGRYPNNWTGFFSGTVWEKTDNGDYYLHLFSKKQPDLNFKNPKVIEEFKNIMAFWLEKGIAGFRCDVCNVFYKQSLENGKRSLVLTGLEHYHQTNKNHEILQELKQSFIGQYDLFMVGETVLVNTKEATDLIKPEKKELDLVFGFEHMETDQFNNKWFKKKFNPTKFFKVLTKWQEQVYWNANYFENHDQPRSVTRYGNLKYHYYSSTALSTLLLSLKGTPFIFQGQEIGMTNYDFKTMADFKDLESKRIYDIGRKLFIPKKYLFKMIKKTSRDNARTPMQWDDGFGFSTHKPWLNENPNKNTINVKDQMTAENSILKFYKEMIAYRKDNKVLLEGEFKMIKQRKGLYIFERELGQKKQTVIINLTKHVKILKINTSSIRMNNYDSVLKDKVMPYQAIILGGSL